MLRNLAPLLIATLLAACGTGGGSRSEGGDTASGPGKGQSAAEINVSLGQAYLEQGRLELALDKLKRALALEPKLSSAHTVIAVVYERINDQAQAQFHYKRATELAPKNGPALNNYGTYLCRAKQYAEADGYFVRALADPFYAAPATAQANRGACAMLWGDLELAEKSLREAVRLQPDSAQALYDMARVLHARKDNFKARAFIQRCESAAGASPELLELAMQIEQGLANQRGVREYRSRLLREFPESSQAQSIANSEASR